MDNEPPFTRRLLLRRFAAGSSIYGTFLLPPAVQQAMAAGHGARPGPHAPVKPPVAGGKPSAPLVMLDPGHGGKDPGAIGVSGTYEKHVSLATALELKRQLESGGRYRVEYSGDLVEWLPLGSALIEGQVIDLQDLTGPETGRRFYRLAPLAAPREE